MSNLDEAQQFLVVLFIFDMLVSLLAHGKKKSRTTYDFRFAFLNWIIFLPLVGRVMGWW